MKKKIIYTVVALIVFIVAIVIINVATPNKKEDINYPATAFTDDAELKENGKHSDIEGVSLSVKRYDLKSENPYIDVLWKNETPYEVTYGLGYDIQKKIDGEWVSCATEDIIVPSIACIMQPGEENTQIYDLSYFDLDKGSAYRFTSECYIASNGEYEIPEVCKLYIEFEVE